MEKQPDLFDIPPSRPVVRESERTSRQVLRIAGARITITQGRLEMVCADCHLMLTLGLRDPQPTRCPKCGRRWGA